MPEFLPGIDIAVSIKPRDFLERMAVIGEQTSQFAVERHYDTMKDGALDIVNFRYLGSSPHTEVGGQLIAREDIPRRVLVEMRAHKWDPDPPTRAIYCAVATELMLPLVKLTTALTLFDIALEFKRLFPKTPSYRLGRRSCSERFAILANTTSLHPFDWDRFYALVREGRQELPDYELRAMLVARGFSNEKAGHLSEIYTHLWNFKRRKW